MLKAKMQQIGFQMEFSPRPRWETLQRWGICKGREKEGGKRE